tara:strand:- start:105 stop:230 length:126 start_codon:yes stop_codon:yes gene_type:complete
MMHCLKSKDKHRKGYPGIEREGKEYPGIERGLRISRHRERG